METSRQWAIRCVHEASTHDANSYITLTYSEENLPWDGSLNKKHFQDFVKRFRKAIHPKKIRFFHCGEYGEKFKRPHYHALIFGYDFPDKIFLKMQNGYRLDTSAQLERLWPFGFNSIGNVTFESAAYVARYITKKINGENADIHYRILDEQTGELTTVSPEYITMSRRPGIGHDWYIEFQEETTRDDFVVLDGKKLKLPAYYDRIHAKLDERAAADLKAERTRAAKRNQKDKTPERLAVREIVKKAQHEKLVRPYEQGK